MLLWDGDCGHRGMFFLGCPVVISHSLVTSCVRVLTKRKWIFSFYLDGVECNGGPFWQAISSYVRFFPSQFTPKKCDILQVYFWPIFWSLTVCSESHKSAIVACVLVRWHSWTWFVYVVGPIRLVSWPAWRASSGAVSPQTQARRACQLNRKHSRFRGRTCGHNAGFLMCFGQQ